MNRATLQTEYAPYNQFAEFDIGYNDYLANRRCPYGENSIACQAWDRGAECAMRVKSQAWKREA